MKYEVDAQWHASWMRAVNEDLTIDWLKYPPEYIQGGFLMYLVGSSRQDGSVYPVQLHYHSREVQVICACNAGQHRKPCKHAALVLYQAGFLVPTPEIIQQEEEQEIAA